MGSAVLSWRILADCNHAIGYMQATLSADAQDDHRQTQDLTLLLEFLRSALKAGRSFDLVQGLLALVLQLHGATIQQNASLLAHACTLQSALQQVRSLILHKRVVVQQQENGRQPL